MADIKEIIGKRFEREAKIDGASMTDKRTIDLAFSSEAPVERHYGTEILDHRAESVDLSRLNNAHPLLVNHDPNDQVGVVERAWLDGGKGRATVRFGSSARAQEIYQDVKDGIRQMVSVGYQVLDGVKERMKDGLESFHVTRWQPMELSIVSIPADATVGIGRSKPIQESKTMPILFDPQATGSTGGGDAAPPRKIEVNENEVRSKLMRDMNEIRAIGQQAKLPIAEIDKAISEGRNPEDFRKQAFEYSCREAKPIETTANGATIGMNDKERKRYSMLRAINCLASGNKLDGIEGEASREVEKIVRRTAQGFFMPDDILAGATHKRALSAVTFGSGGSLVATDLLSDQLIELYRAQMMVGQAGARMLTGLVGNVAIPSHTGTATTYWLTETAAVTATDQTTGQLALTPKRLAAATAYSKQFLSQSSISAEDFVRGDIMDALAVEKDRVALRGSGAAGEPRGVSATSGLAATVTFVTNAPTFLKVVEMETNVANNNADRGSLAYFTTSAGRGLLKSTVKASNTAVYLWENNEVNGYRAFATNNLPTTATATNFQILFGNWNDLIIAEWAGIDVTIDPYSLSLNSQVRIVVQLLCDVGIRHAKSFCGGITFLPI